MPLELLKSKTGRTLIESHRGMEGDVPENSWSAVQLGHKLGADLIEIDIQIDLLQKSVLNEFKVVNCSNQVEAQSKSLSAIAVSLT